MFLTLPLKLNTLITSGICGIWPLCMCSIISCGKPRRNNLSSIHSSFHLLLKVAIDIVMLKYYKVCAFHTAMKKFHSTSDNILLILKYLTSEETFSSHVIHVSQPSWCKLVSTCGFVITFGVILMCQWFIWCLVWKHLYATVYSPVSHTS